MTPALSSATLAPVLEVFASIQGEGAFVGEPQVFLRLRGCPLRCRYCDTPGSWELSSEDTARVVGQAGARREEEGLVPPFRALCWVADAEGDGPQRTISVTGGEPLLWPEFILGLAALAPERRLHLETAGCHTDALKRVLSVCDHISLDLKAFEDLDPPVLATLPQRSGAQSSGVQPQEALPSDAASWVRTRRKALELVRGRDAAAKIVVCAGTDPSVYEGLLGEVAAHAPELPCYLTPATPVGSVQSPAMEVVERLADHGRELELTVRVLPQVHRALRIR